MKKILLIVFMFSIFLPNLSFASFDVSLKYGSRGSAVTELQNFLQTRGFLKGKVDGKYGPATLNAVKSFQLVNGLSSDGSFGKASRAKAASILTNQASPLTNVQPTNIGTVAPSIVDSTSTNLPLSGTLNLIQSASYINQLAIAPKPKFKLGDFSLTNNTTEAINLNQIEVDLSVNSDPYIVNLYISNLYVVYGNSVTELKTAIGNNYWPINLQLSVGQTINLSVYGDVFSTIPLNAVVSSGVLVSGVSKVSTTNVYTNSNAVLPGQSITFGLGSLSVSQDSTTPASKMSTINKRIIAGKFQISSSGDSYNVSELKFIIPGFKNILTIPTAVLLDTDTQAVLATASIQSNYNSNDSIFDFNINLPIPFNSSKHLTLSYDLSKILDSSGTNINVAPSLAYIKATNSVKTLIDGVASNYTNFSTSYGGITLPSGGVVVNGLYLFKSIPTLTHIPLDSTNILNNSNTNLITFSIAADPSGDVSIKQLTFITTVSDPNNTNPRLNNFSFFKGNADYTGLVAIGSVVNNYFIGLTGSNGVGTGAGVINSIVVNFVEEEVIPAGKTQTYTLKAYASNFGPSSSSGSDSISTYIPSDTSMLDGGSYLKTVFSKFYHGLSKINLDSSSVNYYNLLWSDMSETFPNTRNNFNGSYTKDWYNGFGILNLPLTTQAVNAQ